MLKEELSATESRLTGRMAEVEAGFSSLKEDMRSLEERMNVVERKVGANSVNFEGTPLERRGVLPNLESQNNRIARYWKARQSLRIWPIKGEGEDMRVELQRFLANKLRLGEDVLSDAGECSIRRIPSNKGSKIEYEATVEFPSVELRDVVKGAAYNLAGQANAGIRLEIAHHLMANFKALSTASYKLKQKFPGCKRNIKYDDEHLDLILDFKTADNDRWKRLRPEQARELQKAGGEAAEEMSTSDMSELLGAAEDEQDDEY